MFQLNTDIETNKSFCKLIFTMVVNLPKHLAYYKQLLIGEKKHKTMNITLPNHSGLKQHYIV